MNYRILGLSGLRVSAIGLGCMGMSHAYGAPADREEMTELLADAVEMGYTFFDTAESYGTPSRPHDNEELLGKALEPFRNRIVLATKFGISFDNPKAPGTHAIITDSRPETILRSVDGSLKRLRTDHIDLYYQHRPDPEVEPETVASVMARWNEALFPVLEELGIGFVAFSPLANGLLSRYYTADDKFDAATDYRASMPQFREESFSRNRELFALLDDLAEQKHATPAQISLAWMMCKRPWIVPIPGTRRLCRLKENIGAADLRLSPEEVRSIDSALDNMNMSDVFSGSPIKGRQ